MLEYDNSAFYYFALTLLTIYILPGTWYALSELFLAFLGSGEVGTKPRTKGEQEKANSLKQKSSGLTRLNTTTYIANLVFLAVAWLLFIYLITLVINDGEVSTFDPYQILGIEQGVAVSEIKKAYRKLSLKYHPDKNIGDKLAEEMFMKIAKAYEALTNEASKENYEKYGNPDGKQALEVSIGLPKILLDNPKVVLVLYLVAMVVVIPSVVGWWYSESKQYGEKNILYDTYNAFYSLLQQSSTLKQLPEVLAASAEFRKLNETKPGDEDSQNRMLEKFKKEKLMLKPKYDNQRILRGNVLLHSHLLRLTKDLSKAAKQDLAAMLSKAPDLLEGMIEIAYQRKWPETAVQAIKLSQCIVQALWPTTPESAAILPFKQLPFLSDEDIKQIVKGAKPQAKSLADYLRVPDDEKKGLSNLSSEERLEFLQVCKLFPRLHLETKLFVEEEEKDFLEGEDDAAIAAAEKKKKEESEKKKSDAAEDEDDEEVEEVESRAVQAASNNKSNSTKNNNNNKSSNSSNGNALEIKGDQIFEQDLVTLRVIITRENLPSSSSTSSTEQKNSAVYAPAFPATLYEGLWIVLLDKMKEPQSQPLAVKPVLSLNDANIHAFEKVSEQGRVVTHDLHFMAPQQAGRYEMELRIFSDSYLGLDEVRHIEFEVLPASLLPEYAPHPEDVELDNEPTLFEQMMAANVDDESSDEEDNEEDSEQLKSLPKKSSASAVNSNKNKSKKAAVIVEDVDSD